LAHVALGEAFALLVAAPVTFSGFFYHPKMVAVVHLVTLGWITGSILGALYLVAPMALMAKLPARRTDFAACGVYAVGVLGMVSHFWLDSPRGMVWSAATVTLALLWVAARAWTSIARAKVPTEVKLCFFFAFLNLVGAASLGVALGIDKVSPWLGGYVLTNVYAHAHLAALGWASLLAMAVGYRLLPMLLPSALPTGPWVLASVLALEAGVAGLALALIARHRWGVALGAAAAALGIALFLSRVGWMFRHRRPAPRELKRPDWGTVLAIEALLYLAAATGLGLALAWGSPQAPWKVTLASLYAVCGLLGFLALLIAGVTQRLWPLYAWFLAYQSTGYAVQPPSPHHTPVRPLQAATALLWTAGLPLLGAGLFLSRPALVRAGSLVLLAAVLAGAVGAAAVLRRARSA
jgi:hypothetical protein